MFSKSKNIYDDAFFTEFSNSLYLKISKHSVGTRQLNSKKKCIWDQKVKYLQIKLVHLLTIKIIREKLGK